jgi:UMP-CMP kinase
MKLKICPFSLFLFTTTAITFTRNLKRRQRKDEEKSQNDTSKDVPTFQVVFVLGGPGSGKGTQCTNLTQKLPKWGHLSTGDLLRAERQCQSALGAIIDSYIGEGRLVPAYISVDLLSKAMREIYTKDGTKNFLIDGFPRNQDNVNVWNQKIHSSPTLDHRPKPSMTCKVLFVLFLDCPDDVMVGRLLERGKSSGRTDDQLDTIKRRLEIFHEESMPIIEWYHKEGILRTVRADRSVDIVFQELLQLFQKG